MAYLDLRADMTLWLDANTLLLDRGAPVALWRDGSGNGRDFGQAVEAKRPRISVAGPESNWRPGVRFDGVDDALVGPNLGLFLGATATFYVVFVPRTVAANSSSVAGNDALWHGSVAGSPGMFLRGNAGPEQASLLIANHDGVGFQVVPFTVRLGNIYVAVWQHAGPDLIGTLDDPFRAAAVASGAPIGMAAACRLGENFDGTSHFAGTLHELLAFRATHNTEDRQHVIHYLASRWCGDPIFSSIPRPDTLGMGRNIGSRRLWTFRRSRLKAELPLDLIYGDLRIGADLPVSHPEWPRPDGQGAGNEKWERALTRVYESELDLDALKVNLLVGDLDRMLHVYQETGIAVGQYSPLRNGPMLSTAAQAAGGRGFRCVFRPSRAWIEDAGDGRIVAVGVNDDKVTRYGLLVEGEETNELARSSFVSGIAGLTPNAGSGNVGLFAGPPLLFDRDVTPQGIRFLAGTPHVNETRLVWPATAATFSEFPLRSLRLLVDHCDLDGTPLGLRLQRTIDGASWDNAAATWRPGSTTNLLPVTPNAMTVVRDASGWIDLDGVFDPTALIFSLVLPAGGPPGRRNAVFHVGLQSRGFHASSRIVTDGAAGRRDQDLVFVQGLNLHHLDHGTILMKIRTLWQHEDLGVPGAPKVKALFHLGYIGLGGSRLSAFYQDLPGEWAFRTEGLTRSAVARMPHLPERMKAYRIAVRWIGAAGELGLRPGTVSVLVEGVRGTDGIGDVMSFSDVEPTFVLGNDLEGNALDGYVKAIEFRPRCWTDAEIAAWGI